MFRFKKFDAGQTGGVFIIAAGHLVIREFKNHLFKISCFLKQHADIPCQPFI